MPVFLIPFCIEPDLLLPLVLSAFEADDGISVDWMAESVLATLGVDDGIWIS